MQNNLENNSAMLRSADPERSADSLGENHVSLSLEQHNYRVNERILQRKSHERIEEKEHRKADSDLENDINNFSENIVTIGSLHKFIDDYYSGNMIAMEIAKSYLKRQNDFGVDVSASELIDKIDSESSEQDELSTADRIKNYKEKFTLQGKSQTEVLQLLISKFENEEAVSTWVENWKNFLKLHQFAKSKPPKEQKAIQRIIAKADFTNENAFENTLAEISQNTDISTQTKLEISRKYDGANVFSVDDMDSTLKEVKNHKQKIEKAIDLKSRENDLREAEIDSLKSEIEELPFGDTKRQELELKLKQKTVALKHTKSVIENLKNANPKDISFQLREGFSAKLNPNGTRSIRINSVDFVIKLPSNFLPLTGAKNLWSINLAFPYLALRSQNIADDIFSPHLRNNDVPSKENRKMGHLILSSLGIDDTKILSEENIKQLNIDLARLTSIPAKTSQECLIELGIYDIASQSLNKQRFIEVLKFMRKN